MSATVAHPEVSVELEGPPRKRWTREECALIEESGMWDGQRFELIDGELYNKMGKKWPHTAALISIRGWLIRRFGNAFVPTETSIDVSPEDNPTNEPEPDLVVLARSSRELTANPTPSDIRLTGEISDTTLRFDLTKKAALYARAGIPEYWVLDVKARRLIVHRNPALGGYGSVIAYAEREAAASVAVAEAFSMADIFD